ncbi:enoyl-CoA hydratase [Pseudonocardia sp. KRD291]|uniref:enoyl-CoA hydratase n=1 Tax=Pseudonocardia sp. KRD291 TaxID=2792007 RepID=UPI001C4A5635|nr:enoyl-CoA hydratase [Pseudonocardia sp. KRD291]MBW0106375.1 enoyl-CoA hydratase [Pseudonocardia sp. KRD291]
MNDVLRIEDTGAVRTLTLHRPQARNALDGELVSALFRALEEADADGEVRAIVLTGTDPAFCAGVDLKQAAAEGIAYFRRFEEENCVARVAECRTPVVCAVNGHAFTGGLEIVLGCDVVLASDRAVFADTHVRVGVLPGGGLTARLPQLVGPAWARRMSMTGEIVDARLAERIGLVTEIVQHEDLLRRAGEIAAAVAEVPAPAMTALKRIYTEGNASIIDRALAIESSIASRASDPGGVENRYRDVAERNRERVASRSRGGVTPRPREADLNSASE